MGDVLGESLGSGLQALANFKLQQLQEQRAIAQKRAEQEYMAQQQLPGLQALFPQMSAPQLASLAVQSPELLKEVYKQSALIPQRNAEVNLINSISGATRPNVSQQSLNFDLKKPTLEELFKNLAPVGNEIPQVQSQNTFGAPEIAEPSQERIPSVKSKAGVTPPESSGADFESQRMAVRQYVNAGGKPETARKYFDMIDKKEQDYLKQKIDREKLDLDYKKAESTEDFRKQRLGLEKRKIIGGEEKLAIETTKPFIQEQLQVLKDSPKLISDYDKLIAIAERSPGKIRTGNTAQLLQNLGLQGYEASPEENIAQQSIASIAQAQMSGFRGLGNFSDRDARALERSLPSLLQTPEGLIAISKGNRAAEQSRLVLAKETQKLRKKNKGVPPIDIDIQALEASEPERMRLANEAKAAFRKAGVKFGDENVVKMKRAGPLLTKEELKRDAKLGDQIVSEDGKDILEFNGSDFV